MKNYLIPIVVLVSTMVSAGDLEVSLQGEAIGFYSTYKKSYAEDASVAFFNPAGMSFIPNKLSVVAGGFGVLSKVTYQNLDTREDYSTNNPIGTPFMLLLRIN